MKCITLTQPWATLLISGAKRYETRKWSPKYRGRIYIHAGKKLPYEAQVLCQQEPFKSALARAGINSYTELPLGQIIGSVEIVDVRGANLYGPSDLSLDERAFGDFRPGMMAWETKDPKPLTTPIPYTGHLQVFDIPDILFQNNQ